jgi:hypothetical protein
VEAMDNGARITSAATGRGAVCEDLASCTAISEARAAPAPLVTGNFANPNVGAHFPNQSRNRRKLWWPDLVMAGLVVLAAFGATLPLREVGQRDFAVAEHDNCMMCA